MKEERLSYGLWKAVTDYTYQAAALTASTTNGPFKLNGSSELIVTGHKFWKLLSTYSTGEGSL